MDRLLQMPCLVTFGNYSSNTHLKKYDATSLFARINRGEAFLRVPEEGWDAWSPDSFQFTTPIGGGSNPMGYRCTFASVLLPNFGETYSMHFMCHPLKPYLPPMNKDV